MLILNYVNESRSSWISISVCKIIQSLFSLLFYHLLMIGWGVNI